LKSFATNCGPLSEMIRGRAWGNVEVDPILKTTRRDF
jgi:hypothetical protein